MFYRVWHVAPFAFVIFYAGLQTVNQDTLESAMIDGASRWERLRYVIVPHLMPLIVFIALIHLMDCYRVFEEIVGFRSQAHVISLQWLTYDFLTPDDAGNRVDQPRLGQRDADHDRHRHPADPAAAPHLARPQGERALMSTPRAMQQSARPAPASAGFLAFWCLLAAFPIFWIAVMSFKSPVDAFAANPLDVIFGPATRAAANGLSRHRHRAGHRGALVAVRFAMRRLPDMVSRFARPGMMVLGWVIGGHRLRSGLCRRCSLASCRWSCGLLNAIARPLGPADHRPDDRALPERSGSKTNSTTTSSTRCWSRRAS